MNALELLQQQNTRTVHLLLDGEAVRTVPEGTPGSVPFTLTRVPARDIRLNILYAALGRDQYVQYANWYNAQAQQAVEATQATNRKPGEQPFDDSLPDDEHWRAHSVALEEAVTDALLSRGMANPTYAEAHRVLGAYAPALVLELVQWGREAPEDPNSSSGSYEPP